MILNALKYSIHWQLRHVKENQQQGAHHSDSWVHQQLSTIDSQLPILDIFLLRF